MDTNGFWEHTGMKANEHVSLNTNDLALLQGLWGLGQLQPTSTSWASESWNTVLMGMRSVLYITSAKDASDCSASSRARFLLARTEVKEWSTRMNQVKEWDCYDQFQMSSHGISWASGSPFMIKCIMSFRVTIVPSEELTFLTRQAQRLLTQRPYSGHDVAMHAQITRARSEGHL